MKRMIAWSYWVGWIGMAISILMPFTFYAVGPKLQGPFALLWFIGVLASIVSGVLLTKQSWWCPVFIITGFLSMIVAMSSPAS